MIGWIVLAAVFPQDATEGLSGSRVGLEAVAATRRPKSFRVEFELTAGSEQARFKGVVRGLGASVTGAAEIWSLAGRKAIRDARDNIVPPERLGVGTEEFKAAALYRHPGDDLSAIESACGRGRQEAQEVEKVDGTDCRKVLVTLDQQQKGEFLKELLGSTTAGGLPMPDPTQLLNLADTGVVYTVWVSISDLRILRYTLQVTPVARQGLPGGMGLPGIAKSWDPGQWKCASDVKLSRFDDKDLEWNIPPQVTRLIGLR